MVFQGCYTVISSKKLTHKTWFRNHKHEFFYDTDWGKEWNYYYYDPMIKRKTKKTAKEEKANIHEHEVDVVGTPEHHCRAYTDCCLLSCLFPGYFCDRSECVHCEEEQESEDSTRVLPPEKPKRRRGM